MKITESQLRKIVKQEAKNLVEGPFEDGGDPIAEIVYPKMNAIKTKLDLIKSSLENGSVENRKVALMQARRCDEMIQILEDMFEELESI